MTYPNDTPPQQASDAIPTPIKSKSGERKSGNAQRAKNVEFCPGKYQPIVEVISSPIPEVYSDFDHDILMAERLSVSLADPLFFAGRNIINVQNYSREELADFTERQVSVLFSKKMYATMSYTDRNQYYDNFKVVNNSAFKTIELVNQVSETIGTFEYNGCKFRPRDQPLLADHYQNFALCDTEVRDAFKHAPKRRLIVNTELADWQTMLRARLHREVVSTLESLPTASVLFDQVAYDVPWPVPKTWKDTYPTNMAAAGYPALSPETSSLVTVLSKLDYGPLPMTNGKLDDEQLFNDVGIFFVKMNNRDIAQRIAKMQQEFHRGYAQVYSRVFTLSKEVTHLSPLGEHWQLMRVDAEGNSASIFNVAASQKAFAYVMQHGDPKVTMAPLAYQGHASSHYPEIALQAFINKTSTDESVAKTFL